mgnify:FL=1
MFFLLATLACETAPLNGTSAIQQTIDPSRDLAQASMAPLARVILDPLIAGINFRAVDLSEISIQFGDPSSGALADVSEEELELSSRWDSDNTQAPTSSTHSRSSQPTVREISTGKVSVSAGPEVSLNAKQIDASMPKTMTISQVVRKQRGKVQYCHDTGKTRDSQVNGRITVAWTVNSGKAVDIQVMDNTTGDDVMASCVASQVRSFKFPKDVQEDVSYPFVFQQG